jgi:hypothetical protein
VRWYSKRASSGEPFRVAASVESVGVLCQTAF